MKKILLLSVFTTFLYGCNMNTNKEERIQKIETELQEYSKKINKNENNMKLGSFSISLSVKDIKVSKNFYENFGFVEIGGGLEKNYLIMKNENSVIGLFQGMFEGNILTFNPGWNESGKEIDAFVDIRKIQQELKDKGIDIGTEIEKESLGPASFMTTDPDGNVILIDQHR